MKAKRSVTITALWLRREGNELIVLVEHDSEWKPVVRVAVDGEWQISHIVESSGLLRFVSENYPPPAAPEREPLPSPAAGGVCPLKRVAQDIFDDLMRNELVDETYGQWWKLKQALASPCPAGERLPMERPKVVCLCGSTRFFQQFQVSNFEETMAGRIVLSVGFYPHSSEHHELVGLTNAGYPMSKKAELDELHCRKIDLADEVLVLNVGGYIGDSTRREIAYAEAHGKPVRYLEPTPATSANPDGRVEHEHGYCWCGATHDDTAAAERGPVAQPPERKNP